MSTQTRPALRGSEPGGAVVAVIIASECRGVGPQGKQ